MTWLVEETKKAEYKTNEKKTKKGKKDKTIFILDTTRDYNL